MSANVLTCPKCHAPLRLRDGETTVQCTACGATVTPVAQATEATGSTGGKGGGVGQAVLVVSLLITAVGFVTLAEMRKHGFAQPAPAASGPPTPIYTAPPVVAVVPTPEGEVAWESRARAPVIANINADAVEDIFGFFRVWDGRSAWVAYAGAFDGATLKPLWRTEVLDPQLVKQQGVVPLAVVAGTHIVVADTSANLRIFDLATGEKQSTLKLPGAVMDVCRAPDQPNHVWVKVVGDGDTAIDLATGKSDLAPRPKWCPAPAYEEMVLPLPRVPKRPTPKEQAAIAEKQVEIAACDETFENGVVAHAACRPVVALEGTPSASHEQAQRKAEHRQPLEEGFKARYELSDGPLSVVMGTKDDKPHAVATTKGSSWTHSFVPDDTKAKPLPPLVADLAFGRLYAVYDRVYFDANLTAVDAKTGQTLWEAPLVGSLPGTESVGRGGARGLIATAARVYVVRSGGGLDVLDAATGKPVGSIGKQ